MAERLVPEPDEPEALRGRARLAILFAAVFALLCLASTALPTDRYLRYQLLAGSLMEPGIWIYERTQFDRTPIDVAIIGPSRTQIGLSGPRLQAELTQRLGRPVHAVNLSLPRDGRDIQYVIARQLLETHPEVKLIVLSVIEHPARISHPTFRAVADVGEVLREPLLFNRSWLENVAYLPYRQLWVATQSLAPSLFGVRTKFDPAKYDRNFDSTVSLFSPETGQWIDRDSIQPEPKLAANAKIEISIRRPRYLPKGMVDYEYAIERRYTPDIIRLAEAKGVKIVFVYLPVYAHPMPIEDLPYYQQFGPYFDGGFLSADYRNYSDYGHFNQIGTKKATHWLADRLIDMSRKDEVDLGAKGKGNDAR